MKKIKLETVYKLIIITSLIITLITITVSKLTTKDGIILKKDLTVNFRDEVYIKDFISSLEGTLVDNYKVDTSTVGQKDLLISFQNKYNFIVNKKITIEIKDITSPTIVVSDPYTIEEGSVNNLVDTIFCADDYDDNPNCHIEGDYDLNTPGNYKLKISATDQSGNNTSKNFILNITKKTNKTTSSKPIPTYTSFNSILKKYKNDNNSIGLDLSKWQEEVDFAKLKEQGVEFVMLKIGGQKEIGGEFHIDPKFYDNIKGALANDIKVGLYFYSYATTEKEAIKQADWIANKIKNYEVDLPIAFDWENWHNYTSFHLSFNSLNKIASAFVNQIEKHNYKAMLYSSKSYLENIWYQEDYTTWIAYYTNSFPEYNNYYMWQLCSDGKIDGIKGYVDIDIMPKTFN